jgi:hypothetical protein
MTNELLSIFFTVLILVSPELVKIAYHACTEKEV